MKNKNNDNIVINLVDKGQDIRKITTDKNGVILECDFHASMYVGRTVNLTVSIPNSPLTIYNQDGSQREYFGLIVESVSKKYKVRFSTY